MWNKEEWAIFIISFFIIMLFTKTGVGSGNDASRMGAIQSIVEFNTFAIDNSQYNYTNDKVFVNGHFYSDKPPLSYLLGVPPYWVLNRLNIGTQPRYYYFVTLFSVGLFVSIMLVYFFRLLAFYGLEPLTKIFYVASLGFGTLLFTYSVTVNNHAVAAAFLFLAFYFILKEKHYILAGFLGGLLSSIDLVAGNIFLGLFIILLLIRRSFKQLPFFLLGAGVPIFIHLLLNWIISGSIVPMSFRPELFNYPGTPWTSGIPLRTQELSGIQNYTYGILFGVEGGFLSYAPVLFFSLAGLIYTAVRKNKLQKESILVFMGTIGTFLFYIFRTDPYHYDGCAIGYRYGVALIPLLYFFTPSLFKVKDKRLATILGVLFFIAVLISAFYSFENMTKIWSCYYGHFALLGPFHCGVVPIA